MQSILTTSNVLAYKSGAQARKHNSFLNAVAVNFLAVPAYVHRMDVMEICQLEQMSDRRDPMAWEFRTREESGHLAV